MPHNSLADTVLFSIDVPSQIASTAVNGTVIDMQGWDGVTYIFNLGAMTSTAIFDARVMSSANSNFSGNANITNAALVQVTTATPNNVFVIDVFRPTQRYLKTVTTPATANTQFASVAARYRRSGILPPTAAALQTVKIVSN